MKDCLYYCSGRRTLKNLTVFSRILENSQARKMITESQSLDATGCIVLLQLKTVIQ